jgi:hypothetical protein
MAATDADVKPLHLTGLVNKRTGQAAMVPKLALVQNEADPDIAPWTVELVGLVSFLLSSLWRVLYSSTLYLLTSHAFLLHYTDSLFVVVAVVAQYSVATTVSTAEAASEDIRVRRQTIHRLDHVPHIQQLPLRLCLHLHIRRC